MSATLIYSTGVKGPHNKRGQIRCKRGLPSFFAPPLWGKSITGNGERSDGSRVSAPVSGRVV